MWFELYGLKQGPYPVESRLRRFVSRNRFLATYTVRLVSVPGYLLTPPV